mgnify:CR=1 FL=1
MPRASRRSLELPAQAPRKRAFSLAKVVAKAEDNLNSLNVNRVKWTEEEIMNFDGFKEDLKEFTKIVGNDFDIESLLFDKMGINFGEDQLLESVEEEEEDNQIEEQMRMTRQAEERDPKDFECFICYNFMVEPMLLTCCNHHVCAQCLKKIRTSKKPGCACPMCTQPLKVKPNTIETEFAKEIESKYPAEFAEMQAKLEKSGLLKTNSDLIEIDLHVGFHYKLLKKDIRRDGAKYYKHHFTCFVRLNNNDTEFKISDLL